MTKMSRTRSLVIILCISVGACVQGSTSSDKVDAVLEMTTNYAGSVIPKGDILEIRLFEDGRFEYDDYPRCAPNQSYLGDVTVVRRESKTSPESVEKLVDLALREDFQSSPETFAASANSGRIDSSSTTTIKFNYKGQRKKISASDFDDIEYVERRRSDYPKSVVAIYFAVLELKRDIIEKSRAGCKG